MSRSKNPSKSTARKPKSPRAGEHVARSSRASKNSTEPQAAAKVEEIAISPVVPIAVYNKPKSSRFLTNLLRILALFAVVAVTLYIYSIRHRVEEFSAFGYPGIFLIALFANATILLPAPGVAVIYAMGAIFNPWGVGLMAGLGGALGELSGYLAGFSGQAVVERMDVYDRVRPWVEKYGGWAILALSAIPNPFFDIAGIAAGIAKMPLRTFLIFTGIGQIIKMTAFALAGHYSISLLSTFFE